MKLSAAEPQPLPARRESRIIDRPAGFEIDGKRTGMRQASLFAFFQKPSPRKHPDFTVWNGNSVL
jgi:hypothetical protein